MLHSSTRGTAAAPQPGYSMLGAARVQQHVGYGGGATAGIQHGGGGTRTEPIDVTLAGIVTDVRLVHSPKTDCARWRCTHAPSPSTWCIYIGRVQGTFTFYMVHIHRGATAGIQHAGGGTRTSPIDVTLAGIVTDVREVHREKAYCTRLRGEHAETHPPDHTSDDDSKFARKISAQN